MGYSEILNSRPIYMADRMGEIPDCDIMFFNFTTESKYDVERVISAYENEKSPRRNLPEDSYTEVLNNERVEN